MLRGDAAARVPHAEPAAAGLVGREHEDPHLPALLVVLDRVGEQVEDDLLEARAVRAHDTSLESRLVKLDPTRLGQGTHQRQAFPHQLRELHRFQRQVDPTRLDPGQVQYLVDQAEQVLSSLEDLVQAVLLVPRHPLLRLQQLGEA